MPISRLRKKSIEKELVSYSLHKKALVQLRQNLSAGGYAGPAGRDARMDSAAESARLTADRNMRRLENLVKATEEVLAELPAGHRLLIELKYFKARGNQFIADELHISLRTFYHWRDKALALFAGRYEYI